MAQHTITINDIIINVQHIVFVFPVRTTRQVFVCLIDGNRITINCSHGPAMESILGSFKDAMNKPDREVEVKSGTWTLELTKQ